MSKVVKGIKKGLKKIVKGVKTAFKSITESTIGKVLLFAATVYLGGGALGMWETPFASINGALTSTATAGADATATGLASAADAGTVAAEAAGGAATAAEGSVIGNTALAGADATAAGLNAANTTTTMAAEAAGGAVPQGGFINNAMKVAGKVGEYGKKAGEVMGENKLLTAMGFNAVSGALAADAARKDEDEERKRMQENLSVGKIDLGISPGARKQNNSGGYINSRIRG